MKTRVSEAVTLFDKKSITRQWYFKRLALNSVDGLRFYEFGGKLTKIPIIGNFFKLYLILYYKYIHTKSVKLPLKDIEAVINNSSQISVGPCPCRLIHDDRCDKPLYTSMRINSFSEYTSQLEIRENEQRSGIGNEKSRIHCRRQVWQGFLAVPPSVGG